MWDADDDTGEELLDRLESGSELGITTKGAAEMHTISD